MSSASALVQINILELISTATSYVILLSVELLELSFKNKSWPDFAPIVW